MDTDEYPRSDTSMEELAKLRPAFNKDGMVTAGNSSRINDGAAALVLMSARKAQSLAVAADLGFESGILNVNGGAIALWACCFMYRRRAGRFNNRGETKCIS